MKTNKYLPIFFVGLVLSFISPISLSAGMPEATTTKYLKTVGAGFSIDRNAGALYYAMNYQIRENLESPLYVTIQFQNPGNENAPFLIKAVLKPKQKDFGVESPTFKKIKNKQSYEVLIKLFNDEQYQNLVSEHAQQVFFSVPEKTAPYLGIELIK